MSDLRFVARQDSRYVTRQRSMDAIELRRCCIKIGRTGRAIAAEIGINESAFSRMRVGETLIPERIAEAVRAMVAKDTAS